MTSEHVKQYLAMLRRDITKGNSPAGETTPVAPQFCPRDGSVSLSTILTAKPLVMAEEETSCEFSNLSSPAQFAFVDAPHQPSEKISSPASLNPHAEVFAPVTPGGLAEKLARLEKTMEEQAAAIQSLSRSTSADLLEAIDRFTQKSFQPIVDKMSLEAARSAAKELRAVREDISADVLGQLQSSVTRSLLGTAGDEDTAHMDVDSISRARGPTEFVSAEVDKATKTRSESVNSSEHVAIASAADSQASVDVISCEDCSLVMDDADAEEFDKATKSSSEPVTSSDIVAFACAAGSDATGDEAPSGIAPTGRLTKGLRRTGHGSGLSSRPARRPRPSPWFVLPCTRSPSCPLENVEDPGEQDEKATKTCSEAVTSSEFVAFACAAASNATGDEAPAAYVGRVRGSAWHVLTHLATFINTCAPYLQLALLPWKLLQAVHGWFAHDSLTECVVATVDEAQSVLTPLAMLLLITCAHYLQPALTPWKLCDGAGWAGLEVGRVMWHLRPRFAQFPHSSPYGWAAIVALVICGQYLVVHEDEALQVFEMPFATPVPMDVVAPPQAIEEPPQDDEEVSPCEVILYEIMEPCAAYLDVENIVDLRPTDVACNFILDNLENACPVPSEDCVCSYLDDEHMYDAENYVVPVTLASPHLADEHRASVLPSCVHTNTLLSTFSSTPTTTCLQPRCALTELDPQSHLPLHHQHVWGQSDQFCLSSIWLVRHNA